MYSIAILFTKEVLQSVASPGVGGWGGGCLWVHTHPVHAAGSYVAVLQCLSSTPGKQLVLKL